MKSKVFSILYAVFAFGLVMAVEFCGGKAHAGDDYLGSSTDLATDAGTRCVGLRPKVNYATRCTQDSYIHVATVPDGGDNASTSDVIAPQNKLYDFSTTWDRASVCVLNAGTMGTCFFYQHRERQE